MDEKKQKVILKQIDKLDIQIKILSVKLTSSIRYIEEKIEILELKKRQLNKQISEKNYVLFPNWINKANNLTILKK